MTSDKPVEQPKRVNGRITKGVVLNPTGKGGFQERPEDRNAGTWNHRDSYKWNLHNFLSMTDAELEEQKENIVNMTQAEKTALRLVVDAQGDSELAFKKYQDIADRVEGRARQTIDANVSHAEPPHITLEFK